jgi:hypothetical protein
MKRFCFKIPVLYRHTMWLSTGTPIGIRNRYFLNHFIIELIYEKNKN